MIAEFVLIYRFTGFSYDRPGPSRAPAVTRRSPMKNMKRALRRHHVARLKAARRFHWEQDLRADAKFLAKVVDTPCPCSCWMCGNPRRHLNELTRQECRAIDREKSFRS